MLLILLLVFFFFFFFLNRNRLQHQAKKLSYPTINPQNNPLKIETISCPSPFHRVTIESSHLASVSGPLVIWALPASGTLAYLLLTAAQCSRPVCPPSLCLECPSLFSPREHFSHPLGFNVIVTCSGRPSLMAASEGGPLLITCKAYVFPCSQHLIYRSYLSVKKFYFFFASFHVEGGMWPPWEQGLLTHSLLCCQYPEQRPAHSRDSVTFFGGRSVDDRMLET